MIILYVYYRRYSYTASTMPSIRDDLTKRFGVHSYFHKDNESSMISKMMHFEETTDPTPITKRRSPTPTKPRFLLVTPADAPVVGRLVPQLETHFSIEQESDTDAAVKLVQENPFAVVLVKLQDGSFGENVLKAVKGREDASSTHLSVYACLTLRLDSELVPTAN